MEADLLKTQPAKIKVKDLAITSMLTALVFVATKFINVRLPISINGGLIHLGTGMLFISAIVFGSKKGAVSGALGMSLFDIVSGWAPWAPFTFVVRGIMGYIIGTIANFKGKEGKSVLLNVLAVLAGGVWMIIGYYFTEVILYGNWLSPVTSIPGNVMQIIIGAFGLLIVPVLKRFKIVA